MSTGGKPEAPYGNGRETAALTERVDSNQRGLADFRSEVKEALAELRGELRNAGKTNWTTIASFVGIGITIATILGGVFMVIRANDVARIDKMETFVEANIVTRAEHAALNNERAALLQVQADRLAQLRLEVEAIKSQNANVYSARDIILKMQDQIDQLRASSVSGAP